MLTNEFPTLRGPMKPISLNGGQFLELYVQTSAKLLLNAKVYLTINIDCP